MAQGILDAGAVAMKLDHIYVRGFRSLRDVRLEFGPRNVLIGANGSGKSNFLSLFDLLGALRAGRLRQYSARSGGADSLLWFGSKRTDGIRIEISFNGGTNGYEIDLAPGTADQLVPVAERCWFWDRAKHPERPFDIGLVGDGAEAGISGALHSERVVKYVQTWLDGIRSYHFHDTSESSPMRKLSDVRDTASLRPDGSNLAAYLRLLRSKHEGPYALIRNVVRQAAPFFDDFDVEPDRENGEKILLEWRQVSSDHYFTASSLSDGTLRFMALATLLLQPVALRPSVIVLDEPELGLHPSAVTLLAGMVKAASVHTQVLIATQSSLLLDHFEPADVLVTECPDDETQLRRLDPGPLESWLEEYSLGQLWEKNHFGGAPRCPRLDSSRSWRGRPKSRSSTRSSDPTWRGVGSTPSRRGFSETHARGVAAGGSDRSAGGIVEAVGRDHEPLVSGPRHRTAESRGSGPSP